MDFPRVSVLITSYNQKIFLAEAIESVLNQKYPNFEIVIIDDASQDESPELIRSSQHKNPGKIKPIFNLDNLGKTRSFNKALDACHGKYVCFLDGDDLYLPDKIEEQVAFMEANPGFVLTYHDVEVFSSGSPQTIYTWSERYRCWNASARDLVRFGPFICYASTMLNREALPQLQMDERIPIGADWLFWIEALANTKSLAGYLKKPLARYRRHSCNVTKSWDWKISGALLSMAVVEYRWPEFSPQIRIRRGEIYAIYATRLWAKKDYRKAFQLIFQACVSSLPWALSWMRLLFREIRFLVQQGGKTDDLISSLVETNQSSTA